eukprot:CAMPEP_0181249800 /NCGR_PEP_ID=MMETSP1096-20121128/45966_1 /TAXON_ID=156174 ORGANISM="Chrysochromulina ericina, Strain CCMP281" /NCGR_SAMPLE_ID=MMETSP1096 /ASSEMBLY_ACC=CAM_ASM_000453 /LENGTH=126 /DNA_ID=CAMNT_0023347199 /DNA_START=423 /DNA_END=799 /DNA_ORIENTATION=-
MLSHGTPKNDAGRCAWRPASPPRRRTATPTPRSHPDPPAPQLPKGRSHQPFRGNLLRSDACNQPINEPANQPPISQSATPSAAHQPPISHQSATHQPISHPSATHQPPISRQSAANQSPISRQSAA